MKKPNILLFQNKSLAINYVIILFSAIGLGIGRFLFPLRFIEIGGTEVLVSIASVIFSMGQLLGIFVLSRLLDKTGFDFLIGISSWIIAIVFPIIPWYPIMFFSKFFEGIGYGILTIAVLNLCSTKIKEKLSEAIGTLLGAVFLGTALGQGIGGLLKTYLFNYWNFSGKFTALQMSYLFAVFISFIPFLVSIIQSLQSRKLLERKEGLVLGHFHFKDLRQLLLIPSFIFILILYSLYDFSHGLYTPNLLVMFKNHGFSEAEAGIIFFLGDATWGIAQIFTGKLADRFNNWLPIVISIIMKGVGVLIYPFAKGVLVLGCALIIVGLAESLIEPARNTEVLKIEDSLKTKEEITDIMHNHKHINFSYIRGRGMEFGIHAHYHEHQLNKEIILGIFQTAGIISFGLGGALGSLLLSQSITLEVITFIGAGIIFSNIIVSLFGLIKSKKQLPTKQTNDNS